MGFVFLFKNNFVYKCALTKKILIIKIIDCETIKEMLEMKSRNPVATRRVLESRGTGHWEGPGRFEI